jgi:hypothetical protein
MSYAAYAVAYLLAGLAFLAILTRVNTFIQKDEDVYPAFIAFWPMVMLAALIFSTGKILVWLGRKVTPR